MEMISNIFVSFSDWRMFSLHSILNLNRNKFKDVSASPKYIVTIPYLLVKINYKQCHVFTFLLIFQFCMCYENKLRIKALNKLVFQTVILVLNLLVTENLKSLIRDCTRPFICAAQDWIHLLCVCTLKSNETRLYVYWNRRTWNDFVNIVGSLISS